MNAEHGTARALVVRFAGDSGDGIQVTGGRYSAAAALTGADLATFPDFPAEIRAPAGTTYGVSAYQVQLGRDLVRTAGDLVDVLVALNPAALKVNLEEMQPGGVIILDQSAFTERNLKKAGYAVDPSTDGSLAGFRVVALDIQKLTQAAVKEAGVSAREAARSRNFWTLGLILWLTGGDVAATRSWIERRFEQDIAAANRLALEAGHAFGETAELGRIEPILGVAGSPLPPGRYRSINGADALCLGLVTGAKLAGLELLYGSYPITPATSMLHTLAKLGAYGCDVFQAEDEIAAIGVALGASYAGKLGVTGTSGPGMALKTEMLGLAIAAELPLVVVNAQRGGPSTGLPTKTEQSDLFQATLGRNADAPLPVVAASSPGDAFDCAIEAIRIAVTHMTPVILLTDGYLANASEPWRVPELESLPPITRPDPAGRSPYQHDPETLSRPWIPAGTKGGRHRIGGLERADGSGAVSYDPANHQRMTELRQARVQKIADFLPRVVLEVGEPGDDLLLLGWGSTKGAMAQAAAELRAEGLKVAHLHLRHLAPFAHDLEALLASFGRVLACEMNMGQLAFLLRGHYGRPVAALTKVSGRPFQVREIKQRARQELTGALGAVA
ncbi:MAG: 2-oxoacid:acceptor oxidoreductase subunit alpha [Geminicoccaceae bacterium]|nr:MAG: 2-oxoacid:acceptor oxidoreductase subunit alpha [Geminicoccaceae bacterium]